MLKGCSVSIGECFVVICDVFLLGPCALRAHGVVLICIRISRLPSSAQMGSHVCILVCILVDTPAHATAAPAAAQSRCSCRTRRRRIHELEREHRGRSPVHFAHAPLLLARYVDVVPSHTPHVRTHDRVHGAIAAARAEGWCHPPFSPSPRPACSPLVPVQLLNTVLCAVGVLCRWRLPCVGGSLLAQLAAAHFIKCTTGA